ncbi:MAG: hypothetical protein P8144_04080 [Gammaproteobacteria bacterium]
MNNSNLTDCFLWSWTARHAKLWQYLLLTMSVFLHSIALAELPWNTETRGEWPRIPANARPLTVGKGWTCKYGYQEINDRCERIILPANARLMSSGHDWDCNPGYRQVGNACEAVHVPLGGRISPQYDGWECRPGYVLRSGICRRAIIPENARLTGQGSKWVCEKGYQRHGIACIPSRLPENAYWHDETQGDWKCDAGYFRSSGRCVLYPRPNFAEPLDTQPLGYRCRHGYRLSGGQCVKMELPRFATLDMTGNDWECVQGFKRVRQHCEPLALRTTYVKQEYMTDTSLCGNSYTRSVTGVCGGSYVFGSVKMCSRNQFFVGEVYYPSMKTTTVIRGKQLKTGTYAANDTLGNYCEVGLVR